MISHAVVYIDEAMQLDCPVEIDGIPVPGDSLAYIVALADAGVDVDIKVRGSVPMAPPTPEEMADIEATAERIRETLGDKGAEEYLEEQLGGRQ